MKNDGRTRGRRVSLNAILAVVTAAGLVYLAWAWGVDGRGAQRDACVERRPIAGPRAVFARGVDGVRTGTFVHDAMLTFMAQRDLPRLEAPVGPLEGGLAERLQEVLDSLGRAPTAASYGRAGFLFEFLRRPRVAQGCYAKAAELDPADHRWPHHLGRLAARSGDAAEAQRQFRRALRLNDVFGATHLQLAEVLIREDHLDTAEVHLRRAIELDRENPHPYTEWSRIALKRGRPQEAVTHLNAALRRHPGHGPAHALLGQAYARLGANALADTHARRAGGVQAEMGRTGDPLVLELLEATGSITYLKVLAEQQHARQDWPALIATLEVLAERDPANPAHPLDLATTYLAVNRIADALEVCGSALARWPDNPRGHEVRSRIALWQQENESALHAVDRAIDLDPMFAPAYKARAAALAGLGRFDEALLAVRKFAALAPEDPSAAALLDRIRTLAAGRE